MLELTVERGTEYEWAALAALGVARPEVDHTVEWVIGAVVVETDLAPPDQAEGRVVDCPPMAVLPVFVAPDQAELGRVVWLLSAVVEWPEPE